MGNAFNFKPITAGTIWTLRFSAIGAYHGNVKYEYRYQWSAWQEYGMYDINGNKITRSWWNKIWYGSP